jgi:hypothetical protein
LPVEQQILRGLLKWVTKLTNEFFIFRHKANTIRSYINIPAYAAARKAAPGSIPGSECLVYLVFCAWHCRHVINNHILPCRLRAGPNAPGMGMAEDKPYFAIARRHFFIHEKL